MGSPVKTIRGVHYRSLAILNPGDKLFFIGGQRIAVETWAVQWGQHEFNYEVNSRRVDPEGKPEAIATTQEALDREFMERRVVTRSPIPLSIGFQNGKIQAEITYGEVSPQVYETKLSEQTIAWSIIFLSYNFVASATSTTSSARNVVSRNRNATLIGQSTVAGQSIPFGFNYLMIYVPVLEFTKCNILRNGFGVTDVIGTDPSLIQRWLSRVTGR